MQGLKGSVPAVLTAALYDAEKFNAMFVLTDKEEAAYFANDLENLLGEKKIYFYPSSFKKPNDFETLDNSHVLQRAEVLNHISKHAEGNIVVTYTEAVSEKVTTKRSLQQNTFDIKRGEKLSIDFLSEFLDQNEFELVDFVFEAGQFAVRGGIMDVFSFAYELPFRIEFGDDMIESIRTFDPANQLSVQPMDHVSIIPNVQTRLLKESKESFFDFIDKSFKFFFKDLDYTIESIKNQEIKIKEFQFEKDKTPITDSTGNEIKVVADDFDTANNFISKLPDFTIVEFGTHQYFKDGNTMSFNQASQPAFNKNFNLLFENLVQNQEQRYENLIIADNPKQVERIYSIFEDLVKPEAAKGKQLNFATIMLSLHEGFIDHDLKFVCYTDHQIFNRYHRFRLKKNYSKSEAISLKEIYALRPGDYITHIDHGVGRFGGLETVMVNGKMQEAIRLLYKDNDLLYISIHSLHRIARYTGKEGTEPSLNKLGSTAWATLKSKAKKKVKDIAKDLIALYAKRKTQKGFAFAPDNFLQTELEASFIYEDTPDQIKATVDVKRDMEKIQPMDRLICGDVGFGKTEIAIRAAFKAVCDSKQVAILVPTTILASQHYRTFMERMKDFPCTIDYINRFKSAAQQKITLQKLAEGKIDILIGTHRILSKDVKFKNLGLMIIDEEQKFGVTAKEKLKVIKINVDTLTLTATPIPRTLQFSLMGARDLSIINTPPPNRFPVNTELHVFNDKVIHDAITYEVSRGGQIFFVHNRISDIHELAAVIRRLCPDVTIAVGHGQMEGDQLEETLMNFIEGNVDVLISTTIIESGLDISNANTIIINQAQNFGLSDLHQMRGRVGRSNKKAFCYLLTPPLTVLTGEARQRLKAIEEFSDLGSGFNVAMRDLDIRGAGNLLGGEQSGFISEIGFETFHKILDEAIFELKHGEFKEIFAEENASATVGGEANRGEQYVRDCQIDTDLEILFPSDYITNITERLNLYKELDDIEEEETLQQFENVLRDRFGEVPKPAIELMNTIRLRWKAKALGFEKIFMKNNIFKGYFTSSGDERFFNSPVFTGILDFIKRNPSRCKLKDDSGKPSITFGNVGTIEKANKLLLELMESATVTV
ncbi:MAG: transcription-repair coupling factor [Bacteroidia bacterium]